MTLEVTGWLTSVVRSQRASRRGKPGSGAKAIYSKTVNRTANLLETLGCGFHTPATGLKAPRAMTQQFRPLLPVGQHRADTVAANGTERADLGIRNVSHAVCTVMRYRISEDEGHWTTAFTGKAYQRRTAIGHSTIDAPMNAISENIHATPPQFAAVAPILHLDTQVTACGRTITLSNGAADAGGR